MKSTPHWVLVREIKDAYNHRLRLVGYARQHGLKPAARRTVRKWLRRYQQEGPSGLVGRSRAPHRQARQTPRELEHQVVALRRQLSTFWKPEFSLQTTLRDLYFYWKDNLRRQNR